LHFCTPSYWPRPLFLEHNFPMYIYKIKDKKNDHAYIGCTSKENVLNRISEHLKKGYWVREGKWKETIYGLGPFVTKRNKLESAIKLHGFHNFYVEILCDVINPTFDIENYYINLHLSKTYNTIYKELNPKVLESYTRALNTIPGITIYKNFVFPFGHRGKLEFLSHEKRCFLLQQAYENLTF